MPSRRDIDPLEMRFILGHVMLFEVLYPGPAFRVRLQGSELTWWIGRELTGTLLERHVKTELESFAHKQLWRTVELASPLGWQGNDIFDGMIRRYEALILPLSDDGQRVDMLLAGIRCDVSAPES